MERGGILHSCVILCLGTRLAESLTRARYLLFPSTRDGTSISKLGTPMDLMSFDGEHFRMVSDFVQSYIKGKDNYDI